jgi:predicted anti-sigma-YlaC factor YlaD
MAEACRAHRGDLAAAALGRIDGSDAVALRAHVEGCAACRQELAELESAARMLPLAEPAHVTGTIEPPAALESRVRERVAAEMRERARRRRRRWISTTAAATAVAAGLVFALALLSGDGGGADDRRVVFEANGETAGTAVLHARAAGTEIRLDGNGFDRGDTYWLWLTGADGERVAAGTFRGTGEPVSLTMTAALPLDAARRVWVTDDQDAIVLDAHLDPEGEPN